MKRAICAIYIVLFSLTSGACQRSKEEAKKVEETKAVESSPSPAGSTGQVETTKSPPKPADDSMADVTITTIPVAGPVYMLQGRGGNIGVSAGEDGVMMVDDQFAPLAPKILEAIKALGKGEPEFVVNTHWHGDHTGGNTEFGPKAAIVAHDNVRKRLSTEQNRNGQIVKPLPASGLPVVTFRETVSLHMNGEEVRVVHFPTGHTDGDSVVFFTGSNVVHMGDHFFNGKFPFVDTSSGGDPAGYAANVKAVLDQIKDDTKIIPGHGPLASKADLANFHAVLTDTIKIVQSAKKSGKSLADVQKAGLPEKYAAWGDGFIKTDTWIETIYNAGKKK